MTIPESPMLQSVGANLFNTYKKRPHPAAELKNFNTNSLK